MLFRVPLWLARAALPFAARRILQKRLLAFPAAERKAFDALPPEVQLEFNIRAVASAFMKLRKLDAMDAFARVRAGLMIEIANNRCAAIPTFRDVAIGALRGERAALRIRG
ncbi:MAG: hypothetical protein ACKVS6_01105 [Planctomycetota bacterium]